MTEPQFTPARSDAIRDELVHAVDSATWPHRLRRLVAGVGLVVAGALVGAGGFAATADIWNPQPEYPPAQEVTAPTSNAGVPAPAGFLPGQPIISLVGELTSYEVAGSERIIQLEAPEGATHVRITLTCTTPGLTAWGFDPGGNNNVSECFAADVEPGSRSGTGSMDYPLGRDLYYVQPAGDAESIVAVQYLVIVETAWGVNDSGETYGVAKPGVGEPDLLAAHGVDPDGSPIVGYLRRGYADEMFPGQPLPTSPAEAIELQKERDRLYPNGWDVPLYDSDGVTQFGTFHVG